MDTDAQLRAPARSSTIPLETKDLIAVDKTVDGQFVIKEQIGKGGMGRVFKAQDLNLGGRFVAIKVIDFPPTTAEQQKAIAERFRREALAAARVTHPNVTGIFGFKEEGGQHYQIMEYVDGRTLRKELQAQPNGALHPDRAVRIVIEFLEGVAALHKAGLCHRDLKPLNIMLTHEENRVKILDLGLVKFAATENPAVDMTLTQCGMPLGSPAYMSPEQCNNLPDARTIDGRSDIYAVGVILYELLTGKQPFKGTAEKNILDQHRFEEPPEMVSPFGELSRGLSAIVKKAMAKDRNDRYQTANQMRTALERLIMPQAPKNGSLAMTVWALTGLVTAAALAVGLAFKRPVATAPAAPKPQAVETAAASHQAVTPPPAPTPSPAPVMQAATVIKVPPPSVEAVPVTAKAGCELYHAGRSGEAVAILTKVVAASPSDVDALFCLCGSYANTSSLASSGTVCQAFLKHAPQSDGRKVKVKIWLGMPVR